MIGWQMNVYPRTTDKRHFILARTDIFQSRALTIPLLSLKSSCGLRDKIPSTVCDVSQCEPRSLPWVRPQTPAVTRTEGVWTCGCFLCALAWVVSSVESSFPLRSVPPPLWSHCHCSGYPDVLCAAVSEILEIHMRMYHTYEM